MHVIGSHTELFLKYTDVFLWTKARYTKRPTICTSEFSLEEFSAANYGLKNISLDLHNSGFEGNIVTEYEKKFSDMGMPIYRLEAFVK
mgnify:CR=1 FL=1